MPATDADASTQQENSVEQMPGSEASARKPDGSSSSKPSAMPGTMTSTPSKDANATPAADGTGGASGEPADTGGSPGDGAGGEPAPMVDTMQPRNCLVGATRCSETEAAVEVCSVNDEWIVKEACPAICQDGACAGDCRQGEQHCGSHQTTEICSDMGAWTPAETCPFVCSEGTCGGDCSPGSLQCGGSDGLTVQKCDESGHWIDGTHCPNICSSGSCAGTCMPQTRRCRTASTPEKCTDAGNWEADLPCPFVCGPDGECGGECRPGSKLCVDQTPTTCDQTGHWVQDTACTSLGKACINGVCGGACSPNSPLRCGPNQTQQKCSDSGRWETQRTCQNVCSAGDCVGVCSPDSKVCSGTTLRTCRGDGLGFNDMVCPPGQPNETATCSGNACKSSCAKPADTCGTSMCWQLQYGCQQCIPPYVWRDAFDGDQICVTRDEVARRQAENSDPMNASADVCPAPLVWRQTNAADHHCVTTAVQAEVSQENAAHVSRTQVATGRQP